jgi:RNA polymerase sigma-70 factor (ECF subfamily)
MNECGEAARLTAEAVARRSYGKLVALLAVRTRDIAAAEDALSEAFASALEVWPRSAPPANPEAWLLTVARRKTIDGARERGRAALASEQLRILTDNLDDGAAIAAIPDQRLALLFVCAHPAIDSPVRAPLMLQAVLGMDAASIASAFLTSPAAMAKRLVRAKEKIRQSGIPFRIPERDELPTRLDAVLNGVYAAFTEGWADPGGTDLARRDFTAEALFLARIVTGLLPDEPEPLGLLSLMLHAEARRGARRSPAGEYVPFDAQNLDLWDWPGIEEAESLLRSAGEKAIPGRFQIEAALQSGHVFRRRTGRNNWSDILQLYDLLAALTGSPVVAVNRALALAEVQGPAAALAALDHASTDARLATYQPYWAARAGLLARTGTLAGARQAYEIAIGLAGDPAVRLFLHQRQAAL